MEGCALPVLPVLRFSACLSVPVDLILCPASPEDLAVLPSQPSPAGIKNDGDGSVLRPLGQGGREPARGSWASRGGQGQR